MFRVLLLASLVPLSIAQLTSSCTTCSTNYGTSGTSSGSSSSSGYNTNTVQRDSTGTSSSNNQPGYLPDYQGDRYTDPQRIAETQALNKAFFDSIGGAPSPPPETPAQQGMGSSTQSPTGSTSTTYSPTSSYGYSTQYYNPSSSSTSNTGYSNPSTSYGNTQNTQNTQNYVAYDTTNQNSPYYYQRVPSTAQYNSVLGVNAGFPQYASNNQGVMYDSTTGGYATSYSNQQQYQGTTQGSYNNPMMYNNPSQSTQGYQMMYNPTQSQTTQGYTAYSNNNQGTTQGYGAYTNQQYNQGTVQQAYGSSTAAPQYSQDSISCCSQVSSTCCYQTQSGNNVQYSPSVYQYGRKK